MSSLVWESVRDMRVMRGERLAALTWRYLPAALAVLALLLGLPTLSYGLGVDDDLLHRSLLLSSSLPQAITRLFVFLDPQTNRALMDAGALPWWTLDTVRVSFLRPLAAFSLWLDYRLWPDAPWLMHAHSVVWYAALCALAAVAYRRLMGRASALAAGVAAVLFTVTVTHAASVSALNARNVLQTAFFGLLTVCLHDTWRREHRRAGAWLAPLCLTLALLSAEAGIATVTYLAAYAVCLERGSWRGRFASLVPYAVVVIAWRGVYQWLGYGAWASDFYVDPGREPLRFVAALVERGPVLLLGQWLMPEPGVYAALSAGARRVYWLIAVEFVVGMGTLVVPLLRRERVARFWGMGMALAALPVCSVNPASGRHSIFVGVGAFGLMAHLIVCVFEGRAGLPTTAAWRVPARIAGGLMLGLHGLVFPVLMQTAQTGIGSLYEAVMDLGPLSNTGGDAVVINAPSPGQFIYVPSLREFRGQATPAHLRVLAPAHGAVEVTRLDERTLAIRPEHGFLLSPGAPVGATRDLFPLAHLAYASQYGDGFFRSRAFPLAASQSVELTGM